MQLTKKCPYLLLFIFFISSCSNPTTLSTEWCHHSTRNGDIPLPGSSTEQTACLILDIDKDGVNDFVIGCREKGPAVVWYQRHASGWERHIIDFHFLPIEAGGAFHDIDSDGDLDIVFGGDWQSNKIWWWENPYPAYDKDIPWKRRTIKKTGSKQHHDQIFGDFDNDGKTEFVFWNQGENKLYLADIPTNPKITDAWDYYEIFSSPQRQADSPQPIFEGLAAYDMDGDGTLDIIGGGLWFKFLEGKHFQQFVIDEKERMTRVAVGQLVNGGKPEVVFSVGDGVGKLKWYEWVAGRWEGHDLVDVDHGHSLSLADFNNDGKLDVFCGEMRLDSKNTDSKLWIFLGDGKGEFTKKEIAVGFGVHEAKTEDLDGDGDIDILGKPYNWETPRLDIWENCTNTGNKLSLNDWQRHVIDQEKPWRTVFIDSADMNNDGKRDIVTGGWWYENSGKLSKAWKRRFFGEPLHNMACVYDFDKDGKKDVLGTRGKGSEPNSKFVWAKNVNGYSYEILDNISKGQGDFLQGIAVADFKNSKEVNIALSWHVSGAGIQLLSIPPDPSGNHWSWEKISYESQDECLSAGDIDSDGDMDLLLGTKWLCNNNNEWICYSINDTEEKPDRNRLSDINQDGKTDAVVGFEAISQLGKLVWYEQLESPSKPWKTHLIGRIIGPMSLDVADMDSDGDLDIVTGEHNLSDSESSKLFIFENLDGKGKNWKRHLIYQGDEHHDGAQVSDMDGDGDMDIISIGWHNKKVMLYENKSICLY